MLYRSNRRLLHNVGGWQRHLRTRNIEPRRIKVKFNNLRDDLEHLFIFTTTTNRQRLKAKWLQSRDAHNSNQCRLYIFGHFLYIICIFSPEVVLVARLLAGLQGFGLRMRTLETAEAAAQRRRGSDPSPVNNTSWSQSEIWCSLSV